MFVVVRQRYSTPLWHGEVQSLLVLKNNRRQYKPCSSHGLRRTAECLCTRLVQGGNISLFSPSDVPGLIRRVLRKSRSL
ncbi:hypothetical protein OK016_01815 [Vibrio chagasii]|nr:hypothetical protein [Vibrio chagasii]